MGQKPTEGGSPWGSLQQASVETGITIANLRAAKAAGCPAFISGSRIRRDVAAWCEENGLGKHDVPSQPSRKEEKLREEIRKLRIQNDAKERVTVPRAKVVESMATLAVRIKGALRQKLENEYPTAVAGLSVPGARVYGKRLVDEIIAEIERMGDVWRY